MSNFKCVVRIKKTGQNKEVYAHDDYFGKHEYGYADGEKVYREDEIELLVNQKPSEDNQATNEKDLSLCPTCGCMTKTVQGKCGKCGMTKDNQGDWEKLDHGRIKLEGESEDRIHAILGGVLMNGFLQGQNFKTISDSVLDLAEKEVKRELRELLKKQKEELKKGVEGLRKNQVFNGIDYEESYNNAIQEVLNLIDNS